MESKKKVFTSEVKEEQNETEISRRNFLKRSAYSAPVLMAMGQLVRPTNAHADGTGGPPPPPPGFTGWNP